MKDKVRIPTDEEYVEQANEASNHMNAAANRIYDMKPDENDTNIYLQICERLNVLDSSSCSAFISLIETEVPDIHDKKDVVQKIVISTILITMLYKFKYDNKELSVIDIIMLIPYYGTNEGWLEVMVNHTVPMLVNNDILLKKD